MWGKGGEHHSEKKKEWSTCERKKETKDVQKECDEDCGLPVVPKLCGSLCSGLACLSLRLQCVVIFNSWDDGRKELEEEEQRLRYINAAFLRAL